MAIQEKTEANKTKFNNLFTRKHKDKEYKFLLDKSFNEIAEGISEKVESSSLYDIILKAPSNKTTIDIPFSIKIGTDENAQEYIGTIKIKQNK